MFKRGLWRNFDFWLFGTVLFLSIFGVVMIRSAVAGNINLAGYAQRQAYFLIAGVVLIFVLTIIDYRFWKSFTKILYAFTVIFLIFILAIGSSSFGAQRWLDIGLVVVQPAEIAKIAVILVLADFFEKTEKEEKKIKWALKSLAIVGGVVVWILLQPNLSTSIVIFVLWFSMIWISGLPIKQFLILGGSAIALFAAAFPFLENYQQQRILNFIFPDASATHGNAYNVQQALISIGSGGLFGQGYGHGTQVQLRFLQVRQTDYIFSAMANEFGLVGTISVILLLIFVVVRCIRAARLANDVFGSMIAYGFATLIFFQTVVNIGVNLNVIPVTGLTLPFISYGGSSLVSLLIGIGFVESVISRRKMNAT
ncbi:MAG: FtsW/RodA/SpoVE family cell cycle protein [Anaerolineaceae bacterium]